MGQTAIDKNVYSIPYGKTKPQKQKRVDQDEHDTKRFLRLIDDARLRLTMAFLAFAEGDPVTCSIHLTNIQETVSYLKEELARIYGKLDR